MIEEPSTPREGAFEDIHRTGIGASEIAGVVGLSPWLDPWIIYARKHGLIDPEPPSARMRWGTRLQRVIAEGFSEETGIPHEWSDKTERHPLRTWQLATPDAFLLTTPLELLEVKTVSLDQAGQWDREAKGEDGMPDYYAVQAYWQLSTLELETCHVAVLIAGNEFRAYVIHRDREIEAILLEEGERFWCDYVLKNVPPPMSPSRTAREYLHRRFPRERERLRAAQGDEITLLDEYAQVRHQAKLLETRKDTLENQLTAAIGEAEGLTWPRGKMTWKRTKDRQDVDWEKLAENQLVGYSADERAAFLQQYTETTRGYRRIYFHTEAA